MINDLLDFYDYGSRSYTAHDVYRLFQKLEVGNYSSLKELAGAHGIPYRTIRNWASGASKPTCIKHIEALRNLNLLPLDENAKIFPYFEELYLYTLLSGSVHKKKNRRNVYIIQLSNHKDELEKTARVIRDEFKAEVEVSDDDGRFHLRFNHPGLTNLLVAAGQPVGDINKQVVEVPDFIDADSLTYYAFMLRGRHCKTIPKNFDGFYLWTASEWTAEQTLDNFLQKLGNSNFFFHGEIHKNNDPNKIHHYTPFIYIKKSQRKPLLSFLKYYKARYTLSLKDE